MKTKLKNLLKELSERSTINNQYEVLTSSQNGIVSQTEYFNKQIASVQNIGYKIIRKGQFTYRSMSDTGLFFINRLTAPEIGIVSPAYPVFEIISDDLLPEYLELFFRSTNFQHQISTESTGSTRLALKYNKLCDLEINVPSLCIQSEIVNNINVITNVIDLEKKQLKLYDELIKSRFIEMFETIDLSEQRNNWKELGLVSKIYTGTTPSTKESRNWDGDVLWITPAEMNQDTFYVYDTVRKITEIGRKSKSLDLMPINTVLLSTRAPIGKVGIVGKPMACNQGFKNFECSNEVNPVFLYILLKNNTEYLNSLGSGTTFLEVSKSKISKMLIPVPKIELQNEFELFVKLIDKSKFIVQQEIKDLQELLDKKMNEYFGQ